MTISQSEIAERRAARWIPKIFFGFFGVVFLVNGVMLYLAISSFNGMAIDGAYQRGLAYNDTLDRIEAQRQLGWQVGFDQAALTDGIVRVTFKDKAGRPISGADCVLEVRRPTHAWDDQTLVMREVAPGVYEATPDLPQEGDWVFQVELDAIEPAYRAETRVFVRPAQG